MLRNYLHEYNGGELITLANRIEDEGQYINEVKKKFDADSANWVWTKETADKKIAEVIVEYSSRDKKCVHARLLLELFDLYMKYKGGHLCASGLYGN